MSRPREHLQLAKNAQQTYRGLRIDIWVIHPFKLVCTGRAGLVIPKKRLSCITFTIFTYSKMSTSLLSAGAVVLGNADCVKVMARPEPSERIPLALWTRLRLLSYYRLASAGRAVAPLVDATNWSRLGATAFCGQHRSLDGTKTIALASMATMKDFTRLNMWKLVRMHSYIS